MGNVGFRQFFKPIQPSASFQKEIGYKKYANLDLNRTFIAIGNSSLNSDC